DVGAQGRPLGADAFLDDLDEHFLSPLENVLNQRLGPAGARPSRHAAVRTSPAIIPRRPAGAGFLLFFFEFGLFAFAWSGREFALGCFQRILVGWEKLLSEG